MSEITIKSYDKEITSWTKKITFEREGETYVATLFWDTHEGYDLVFNNPSLFKPTWAVTEYGWANTLEELLDELTEGEDDESETDQGECDTCESAYETHDRLTRCGECGNCGNCCKHITEGEGK